MHGNPKINEKHIRKTFAYVIKTGHKNRALRLLPEDPDNGANHGLN